MNLTTSSSSSSSSSDSDYDESFQTKKPRTLQERIDAGYFTDVEFKKRFRFSKESVGHIVDLIKGDIEYLDTRGSPLSPRQQVMIALRYYATGSFQIIISDLFGVNQSTICRTVHKVSRAIAKLSSHYIKMPPESEISSCMASFYKLKKMPQVIGCIDGTHIPIIYPGGDNAELYRNRKGYFSINVQAICDSNSKFINLVARWHGSAHDQTIFNFSSIKQRFENNEFNGGILLGDSGYGCKRYLLTPYRNPNTLAQKRYNKAHCGTRVCIETTFGRWKKRFPILFNKSRIDIQNLLTIIVSTAILHNIAIELNDPCDFDDIQIQNDDDLMPTAPQFRNEDTTLRDWMTSTFV